MKQIQSIQLDTVSQEELLPGLEADFPYIATCAQLDTYTVPWHWHSAVELFYVRSGCMEYQTPDTRLVFPAGSGGFVNSGILHISGALPSRERTVELLHLFQPELLSGDKESRIYQKYFQPLLSTGPGILALEPGRPDHAAILQKLVQAFSLDADASGYELLLRQALTEIWLALLHLSRSLPPQPRPEHDSQLKAMMIYIQTHYTEPICVDQLAAAAHISRRLCFQLFQQSLHTTPTQYLRLCRLEQARRLLRTTDLSVTEIALACGLGSGSYFGKLFQQTYGCCPSEYRKSARSS